jgi:predicted transcriptional regulator
MPTTPFSIRIESDIKRRLEKEAELEDRSAGYIAQKAIASYLDAKEFKRASLRAAEAEADKGIFVSWEKVADWMKSWDSNSELPMPEPDIFPESK